MRGDQRPEETRRLEETRHQKPVRRVTSAENICSQVTILFFYTSTPGREKQMVCVRVHAFLCVFMCTCVCVKQIHISSDKVR